MRKLIFREYFFIKKPRHKKRGNISGEIKDDFYFPVVKIKHGNYLLNFKNFKSASRVAMMSQRAVCASYPVILSISARPPGFERLVDLNGRGIPLNRAIALA